MSPRYAVIIDEQVVSITYWDACYELVSHGAELSSEFRFKWPIAFIKNLVRREPVMNARRVNRPVNGHS
jgi:hypothetical protein